MQLRILCPYWLSLVRGFSGPFVRLRFWLSSESGGLCFGLGGSFWLFSVALHSCFGPVWGWGMAFAIFHVVCIGLKPFS